MIECLKHTFTLPNSSYLYQTNVVFFMSLLWRDTGKSIDNNMLTTYTEVI